MTFNSFFHLLAIASLIPSTVATGLFFDVSDDCLQAQYRLALYSNDKVPFGLAAIPVERGEFLDVNACPIIGMDAIFGDDKEETTVEKHWDILSDDELAASHRIDDEKSYQLSDIEQAYMMVEMRAFVDGIDAVRENLAFFPMAILIFLGEDSESSELFDWAVVVDPPQTMNVMDAFDSINIFRLASTTNFPSTQLPQDVLEEVESHNVAEVDFQLSSSSP